MIIGIFLIFSGEFQNKMNIFDMIENASSFDSVG